MNLSDLVPILTLVNSGVLLFLGTILIRISRGSKRIERLLESHSGSAKEEEKTVEISSGPSAFDEFLRQHPEVALLPKGEQATAYRQWRKENGLNWSK
ncbi:MAG: hypothetical protein QM627_01625 [Luteolibacter sp.]